MAEHSVREKVLASMQSLLDGATGAGGTTFSPVLDSPYEGREFKGKAVLSVLEGIEIYSYVTSPDKLHRTLDVELRCQAYIPLGMSLRTGANNVLADLEQLVQANEYWGGNATATTFLTNTVNREDTNDRTVEISLFVQVKYRSRLSDPRT